MINHDLKWIILITLTQMACAPEPLAPIIDNFARALPRTEVQTDTMTTLAAFQSNLLTDHNTDYRLGAGDEITIEVWGHPELSGKQTIGPDGKVTIPLLGTLPLSELTRQQAAETITQQLKKYYLNLTTTVKIDQYASNRILILGQVNKPGQIQFGMTAPTLLETIALAGGFARKDTTKDLRFTRCAIFRGQQHIVWIELEPLLLGKDLSLNLKLQRNDIVYVPEVEERLVYVLGEVNRPGAFPLTPTMSFLELLAKAGGPSRDAAPGRIQVIRPKNHLNRPVNLNDLISAKHQVNISLEEGDIVYVPTSTIAKVNYAIQFLNPFSTLLGIYADIESIRADNQYRKLSEQEDQLATDRAKLEQEKAQNSGLE